jgi:hypothetical protein
MFCTLNIEEHITPIGCPIDVKKKKVRRTKHLDYELTNEFITYGIFCSFNCAQAFVNKNNHDFRFNDSSRLLLMMYAMNSNGLLYKPCNIIPSPDPELMMCYGGPLTKEQYVASIEKTIYVNKGFTEMVPITTIYSKIDNL